MQATAFIEYALPQNDLQSYIVMFDQLPQCSVYEPDRNFRNQCNYCQKI